MAALSFVQSKSAGGTGTAPTMTFTTTPVSGNLLVCGVIGSIGTTPSLTNAGWTTGTSLSGTASRMAMFWKIAGPSEPTTITATTAANANAIAAAEYGTLGEGVHVTMASQENSNSTQAPAPNASSIGGLTGNEFLIVCISGINLASTTFSAQTIGLLTATEREDTNQATNARNCCLYDLIPGSSIISGVSYGVVCTASSSAAGSGMTAVVSLASPQENNYRSPKCMNGNTGIISVSERSGLR